MRKYKKLEMEMRNIKDALKNYIEDSDKLWNKVNSLERLINSVGDGV